MGLLDSVMQSDAQFAADTDQFGEQITYTRADSTALTPTVIIHRNEPTRDPEFGVITRTVDVWIPYDADDSFGLSTKPATGDRITIKDDPLDSGTVVKEYAGMLDSDSGCWLVQFR